MPHQNRVTPFGEIIATPARGLFFGNRGGCFHDEQGRLLPVTRWKGSRWIVCLTEFKGRKRTLLQPGRYTELFFLDEATALAAGQRPCAFCRWRDFNRYVDAWIAGNPDAGVSRPRPTDAIDRQLHRERVTPRREKVTYAAALGELPDGVLLTLSAAPAQAQLLWCGRLYPWTPGGYLSPLPASTGQDVTVLTPRSTVNAIRAGYAPVIHPSAAGA